MATLHTEPIYATFFFVDIVELSDSVLSVDAQATKISILNNTILECGSFHRKEGKERFVLPTGDGMAIGFIGSNPTVAVELAKELHEKLNHFNQNKEIKDMIRVRIGINYGPVVFVRDLLGKKNVWGSGIVFARRVMDIGKSGHILVADRTGEDLRELSDYYKKIVNPIGYYRFKHGRKAMLYSIWQEGQFGNPELPKREEEINEIRVHMKKVLITLEKENNLAHYRTTYEIQNLTDSQLINAPPFNLEPDIDSTIAGLKMKVVDKQGNPLEFTIQVDEPRKKVITPILKTPLETGERFNYSIVFDAIEPNRVYEVGVDDSMTYFEVTLQYPKELTCNPVARVLDRVNMNEGDTVKPSRIEKQSDGTVITWSKWTPSWDDVKISW